MGVGQSIENYAREFLDYDEKNNYGISCLYMPVRVLIDVRQSLKHTKKIHKQGGEAKEVLFKYKSEKYIMGKKISTLSSIFLVLVFGFYLVSGIRNRRNKGIK